MPDMISPVGNTGVSPLQSLSGLVNLQSGMLGLKQQQQTLQTGQYVQQQEQAGAQKEQQAMQERQLFQQAMQSGKDDQGNPLMDAKGNPDANAISAFALRRMPLTGQGIVQGIVKTQADKIGLSDSTRTLGNNYRSDLAGIMRSFQGQDVNGQQVSSALQAYGQKNPEAADAVQYASSLANHLNAAPNQAKKDDLLLHMVQQIQPGSETAKEQEPTLETYTNPQGQAATRQTNPRSLVPTGPVAGASATQGLGPTDQPAYRGEVAAQTAARSGLGAGAASDINQHYAGVQSQAQRAEAFTGIARNVQDFADKAITGTPEEKLNLLNGMLGFIGIGPAQDAKTASDLLEKNMAQLNLQGNTATDFKAMVTQMAQPHMTMNAESIKRAAGQLIGQAQMQKSIGTTLTPEYNHAQATGDSTLYRAKRDAISQIADPRVWEFQSMTPAEQKKFRANLSPQDDAQLGVKYKAAKALGILQ